MELESKQVDTVKKRYDALIAILNHTTALYPKEIEKETYTIKAYKLAVTDLFVEKAIEKLSERAERYNRRGNLYYISGIIAVFLSALFACIRIICSYYFPKNIENIQLIEQFILSFTFFGLMILLAVTLFRGGRAMLDQSELLYSRRHALRQGRLYVHLKGGDIGIDEMEKAFNWNASPPNAFKNMQTSAKAPWGNVISELTALIGEQMKENQALRTKFNPEK